MKDILSHQMQARELSQAINKALSPVGCDDQAFAVTISLIAEKVLTRHPYKEQDFDLIDYKSFLGDLSQTMTKDLARHLEKLAENLPTHWPEL